MSYTKKRLEDLNIMDDFLMNAVATDAEVGEAFCRTLLSTLLQRQLGKYNGKCRRFKDKGTFRLCKLGESTAGSEEVLYEN